MQVSGGDGVDPYDSQADSAGSIPVTRSPAQRPDPRQGFGAFVPLASGGQRQVRADLAEAVDGRPDADDHQDDDPDEHGRGLAIIAAITGDDNWGTERSDAPQSRVVWARIEHSQSREP